MKLFMEFFYSYITFLFLLSHSNTSISLSKLDDGDPIGVITINDSSFSSGSREPLRLAKSMCPGLPTGLEDLLECGVGDGVLGMLQFSPEHRSIFFKF
ncbi:hypothetical protein [Candidatus Mesenet endosymbiont of Phosphuga atrata]|uniref:hypothetical protein n=1 Tax=Candidatus Mesenet endosymbiont of Phosphuga atrata TaxID=3066221 RepID=UPI0030CEAE33